MNKRFWMAFAACYVAGQAMGFVINVVLLGESYKEIAAIMRPDAEFQARMWIFFVTSLISIFLFCYIFTRGYEDKGLMEGVRYGALIGALISFPMAYDSYVVYPIPYSLTLKWLFTGLAYWIILGALLALVYRRDPVTA